MSVERTPEELRAAVETMFRIRAVESPPSAQGLRTVWHRGAKNAELVSELDAHGRVARHELSLFGEVLVWERGRGFSEPSPERMARVVAVLQPYGGGDRIIGHLRKLVLAYDAETHPIEDLGQVTGDPRVPDELLAAAQRDLPRLRIGLPLIVLGVALIVLGVLVLLLK